MWKPRPRLVAVCAGSLVLAVVACSAPSGPVGAVRSLETPAAPGSSEPNLAAGRDGNLYLSWTEPSGASRHALRFSVWEGEGWSTPKTIAAGADWFVNWADFPSMAALADGTLAAHWLSRSADLPYAYDVLLSVSTDGGETWSEPVRPHTDGTPTEHGFVSLVAMDDEFAVVWLDGRETAADFPGPMTVRHALLRRDGTVGRDELIDDRACDCCQTDLVRVGDGTLLVAFRDRSEAEIRDIAISRHEAGSWSARRTVHDDGWETGACPVNGPALAATGDRVACAWFTMADGVGSHVRLAFSDDGGRSFSAPVELGGGLPAGRVDAVLLGDGSALVSWLELANDAEIRVRRVAPSGALSAPVVVSPTSPKRSSGFPRMARHAGATFLAWTEAGDPSRVRSAVLFD